MRVDRIAFYMRVSSDQQSHDSQRMELEGYRLRRGWADPRWYTDTASGAKQSRDGLSALMDQVRRGRVDTIVVYKLDRLGRSLAHTAQLLAEFQVHRVALVCIADGIDTTASNPSSSLQLGILAAFAQFEREVIVSRVNAGIAAARQRGVRLGRPPKAHRHASAVAVMVTEGMSAAQISRALKMPYSTTSEKVRELRVSANIAS